MKRQTNGDEKFISMIIALFMLTVCILSSYGLQPAQPISTQTDSTTAYSYFSQRSTLQMDCMTVEEMQESLLNRMNSAGSAISIHRSQIDFMILSFLFKVAIIPAILFIYSMNDAMNAVFTIKRRMMKYVHRQDGKKRLSIYA